MTAAIANMIREAKTFQIPSVMQTGKSIGMKTLNESLLELVQKKLVEPDEAYAKSVAKSDLAAAFERNDIKLKSAPVEKKAAPAAAKASSGTAVRTAA